MLPLLGCPQVFWALAESQYQFPPPDAAIPFPLASRKIPAVLSRGRRLSWSCRRRKRLAILGATGAGKSTLLCNMIASDIAAGLGVTVVGPN